jgi:hypothetical protein
MRAFLLLLLLFSAGPAFAQDSSQGIAFAQTSDRAWLCRHESPEEAMACARELCAEQAPGETCRRTAWCFPGGWSGVMLVWSDNRTSAKVMCGAPSELGLANAMRAYCAGVSNASICDFVTIVDPSGNERQVQGVIFAGGAAPTGAAAEAEAPPATQAATN